MVKQPDYLIIQVNAQIFAIETSTCQIKDMTGKNKSYLHHDCQLSVARTFHKMQGKTVKSTILSLISGAGISKKFFPSTLPSLYVR